MDAHHLLSGFAWLLELALAFITMIRIRCKMRTALLAGYKELWSLELGAWSEALLTRTYAHQPRPVYHGLCFLTSIDILCIELVTRAES